ncbi:hypothetical protein BT67DRAFT_448813 [Trichocladium antarcticum]|uniref:Uncharacterized protein n=1 Tax=Trichocladium antarcticum TaxID=1450529 RepID=A0AAN6ZFF5_9PEZI|nr:hypothetical protein BT67DRAFT_448813 [Trichocladium antarcticum]
MADARGLHRCLVCSKTYKRREHLQRHRSSHTSERPHRCVLCSASFQRSDVLRRHVQTCDGPDNASPSRRRACNRCVHQKKACDSGQPCQNCAKRRVDCQYPNPSALAGTTIAVADADDPLRPPPSSTRPNPDHDPHLHTHADPLGPTFELAPFGNFDALVQQAVSLFPILPDDWLGIDFSEPAIQDSFESFRNEPGDDAAATRRHPYSFSFLYHFTSRTGLASSFDCATLQQRQQIVAAFHQCSPEQLQHGDSLGATPPPSVSASFDDNPYAVPVSHGLSWSSWLHNPIVLKLQQMVMLIKNVVTVRPNNSTITLTWTPALEQKCLQFFSPSRFAKFIELYWSVWHPNVNFLHRPTFDPAASKAVLLAAMALIGACVSPDPADNEDARMWFNCVEEMVFADDDFCRDIDPPPVNDTTPPFSTLADRPRLQALQAAYVVCLFQNWEGTDASKRRIRRHRFSTVVSAARDLGIDTARHIDYTKQPKHEFNWTEYVLREELIRMFIWIFLLDAGFVIFNNLPHRMVIKEMRMHMASPEACFQAATGEECIEQIHQWMQPTSPFCSLLLREAIETLCLDTLTPDSQERLSQLGPVNLFAMVSAIHYIIFQHQNLFAVDGQLVPIRNGLRNWIAIWTRYSQLPPSCSPHGVLQEDCVSPETMWKRVGFVRFSPEYWLLGSLLTDRISSTTVGAHAQHSVPGGFAPGSFPPSSGGQGKPKSAEPILEKYDQTSMRQVNDLITDFQKFHLD